jgi:hypothetical protein
MLTSELLLNLFCEKLNELAEKEGLTPAENERIKTVFRQAMANPYMNEQHIHSGLTGEDMP